ncbi:MAG: lipoate--protein ligase family protein [Acidimicrobiales bacterium]
MTWPVERVRASPAEFHRREVPAAPGRALWVGEPTGAALVLGSAQRDEVADLEACRAAGVDVVRRRSGGGAVLVVPGEVLWVDLVVPAGDPLWHHDVGRSFHWLGDAFAAALGDVGIGAHVHRGGLDRRPWSDLVCFAGLGPGEVTDEAGAKVVGMAQRRTRDAARFQCAVLAEWDPRPLLALLALPTDDEQLAAAALAPVAAGVGRDRLSSLLDALLRHLP